MQVEVAAFEGKVARFGEAVTVSGDAGIEGYASYFDQPDQGGDVVGKGAYGASLAALNADGRRVKMLWQHDPAQPIGVWEEVREDARGLYVKGRLLDSTQRGAEAIALIAAGAIDGLSIGYRTVKAQKSDRGARLLQEVELWEVSLVTFPMLPSARVGAKSEPVESADTWREVAGLFDRARHELEKR